MTFTEDTYTIAFTEDTNPEALEALNSSKKQTFVYFMTNDQLFLRTWDGSVEVTVESFVKDYSYIPKQAPTGEFVLCVRERGGAPGEVLARLTGSLS